MNSLFWFRQDLRTYDNIGLVEAIKSGHNILPIFIFDNTILKHNDARVGFLIEAVEQLHLQLQKFGSKLHIYYGDPKILIPKIVKSQNITNIYYNKSYGYNSANRDIYIANRAQNEKVGFLGFDDYLLHKLGELPAMQIFTPRGKRRNQYIYTKYIDGLYKPTKIDIINTNFGDNNFDQTIIDIKSIYKPLPNLYRPMDFAKQVMLNFDFSSYNDTRNIPSIQGTSKLSPFIRFGVISIRRLYTHLVSKYGLEKCQTYINELGWREFWYQIYYYQPESRFLEFQTKRRNLARQDNKYLAEMFCEGTTGYPIIDAGIKQLKTENRIHNRVRMILGSFLTKDLLLDRRIGEKLFADYLIDYDANVNIGNWQRSASVGADPKPIRIFNPILQSQRFDPQCKYILHYLPELSGQPLAAIHDPLKFSLKYHKPIVNHYINSKLAKDMYYQNIAE